MKKALWPEQELQAASLTVARRLFPTADLGRKKDHGRAEALLLALWVKGQGVTGP